METLQNSADTQPTQEWQERAATAAEDAQGYIDQITGFEDMNLSEQVDELKSLLEDLAEGDYDEGRKYYAAQEVAKQLTFTEQAAKLQAEFPLQFQQMSNQTH